MSKTRDQFKKSAKSVKNKNTVDILKSELGYIVHTDNDTLKSYQRDRWSLSEIEDFHGKKNPLPAAVVMPETTEQVSRVLKLCNKNNIPVVPYGGGSGVCGSIKAEEGIVILSLEKMSGLVNLNKKNMTATFWAGTNGKVAEDATEAEGLTIGHWPQSIDISTVGGWIATKAAGQYSTAYGNIEDMVLDLEAVLPDGSVINTKQAPRTAAGLDLRQLFLGTEGTHGIVTKVSFSLRELPEASQGQTFSFNTLEDGLDAIRSFMNAGWRPPVVRLYDADEAQAHFPGKSTPGKPLLLLLHEGPKDLVEVQAKNIKSLCEKIGGQEEDASAVDQWLTKRNKVPSFRELIEAGIVADTIEVSATWDKVPGLYQKVTEALKAVPGVALVGAHSSHSYRSGTNLYFTFAAQPQDPAKMEDTYKACWNAAMKATIEAGGSISHHHGIGRVRKDFLQDEIGEQGVELLKKIKAAIDPKDILNPGLLPEKQKAKKHKGAKPKHGG